MDSIGGFSRPVSPKKHFKTGAWAYVWSAFKHVGPNNKSAYFFAIRVNSAQDTIDFILVNDRINGGNVDTISNPSVTFGEEPFVTGTCMGSLRIGVRA